MGSAPHRDRVDVERFVPLGQLGDSLGSIRWEHEGLAATGVEDHPDDESTTV
jgi:hypothetical protein